VQQLASSSAFDLTIKPNLSHEKGQAKRHFYTMCKNLRDKDVGNRLKAEIFTIVEDLILKKPFFGLKRDNYNGKMNEDLWYIEMMLARFEELLSSDSRGSFP
jgi:hypothetical protein